MKQITMFIVAGRTGHSLIVSKAMPFSVLENVDKIYLFAENEGFPVPKCIYITIPDFIKRIKPAIISKLIRFFYEPVQLYSYTRRLRPDFINGIYCLPKGLNSYIISRLTGVKCVNSVIGSILEIETELPFKFFWKKLNLWQLKKCDSVTIKGQRDRNFLIGNGVRKEKMFLFNGAIDLSKFTFNDEKRDIDVLFVGSFIELKGPERIIEIIKKLVLVFPQIKAVMVGEGPLLNGCRKLAVDLGLQNNLIFEGFRNNAADYFKRAKVLLMPSRSDSLPTSMLEAMSCGCVPVISNVGNVSEAAYDRINSRVISSYSDINGFTSAVAELLTDEKLRKIYASNGRIMVEESYSVEKQSELAGKIIEYISES